MSIYIIDFIILLSHKIYFSFHIISSYSILEYVIYYIISYSYISYILAIWINNWIKVSKLMHNWLKDFMWLKIVACLCSINVNDNNNTSK